MPHLYGHFDESGTYGDHPIVSLSGLLGGFVRWQAFIEVWMRLLREYELPALHAATALQPLNALGKMGKAATHEDRAAQIQPFVRSVAEKLNGLAVAVTVDVKAYSKVKELHPDFSEDPHYFMFFMVINNILTNPNVPKEQTIGLIFDDHQEKAVRCYKLLKRIKRQIPQVAERVTSICFSDDRDAPQVQAADLFAYLARLEAMRVFAGTPYPYQSLFWSFGDVMPNREHLCIDARCFSEDVLRAFVRGQTKEIVLARRVRLPRGSSHRLHKGLTRT